ncbi:MAG: PD40 domain-containing protein, partial [Planctomycetes bacterium]|nr:PD40 domain-containing protein [Planctomycetota bacterium]
MRRTLMLLLPVAVLAAVIGCTGSPQPLAVANDVKVEPQAGDTIEERSESYKASIDDGQSILGDITAPMEPRYKSRTPGELTQVSFTRVGGDNSVDASPVEDLVVFSSDRHSPDHNIYVKAPSGKTVTQKTFGPFDEIQPSFSPDGKRIAFACNKNGNYDIWIVETHANGTEVQVTFGDEDDLHPSWAPDGQSVIYSAYSSRSGEWNIMLTNLQT